MKKKIARGFPNSNTASLPLLIPRIEKLTQKRGKKLSSILKLFSVEEGQIVSSDSGVARTGTGTSGQVCENFNQQFSFVLLHDPFRAIFMFPTMFLGL